MLNFIDKYFRAREKKRLLSEIVSLNPDLSELEPDQCFQQYMLTGVDLFMQQEQIYEQACQDFTQADRAGTNLESAPSMPRLLAEVIKYWADRPSYAYALLLLEREIENARLRSEIERYEQLEGLYKEQEKIADQLVEFAENAQKTIEQVNKASLPENRLN